MKSEKIILLFFCYFVSITFSYSQNIGIGTISPNVNAKLDIADSTKGILIPRIDSIHRKAIPNTVGLLVYDINYKSFWYNDGNQWINMTSSSLNNGQNNFNEIIEPIDADGNVYPITKIGGQWWMASNLKTTHFSNGDSIPYISDASQWTSQTSPALCYYNNDSTNDIQYGRLYNWYAANDNRKICPPGWHLPSDSEWTILYNSVSGSGNALKTAGTRLWNTLPATTPSYGNNNSGFSAVPSGFRTKPIPPLGTIVSFIDKNYSAAYWSTKSVMSINPPILLYGRFWFITTESNALYSDWQTTESGFSCRCVKD